MKKQFWLVSLFFTVLLSAVQVYAEEWSSIAYSKTFSEAAMYCQSNRENGYSWVLPRVSQLSELYGRVSGKFWASDASSDGNMAYLYNFDAGRAETYYQDSRYNVICVRNMTGTERAVAAQASANAARIEQLKSEGFVDLGLPSGTMWAASDYSDSRYTFYEASRFGNKLPSVQDFEELDRYCSWDWRGYGYKVTCRNGNSIFFKNNGFRNCEGNKHKTDSQGHYWTSTKKSGTSKGWFFRTGKGYRKVTDDNTCSEKTVHLIAKP